MKTLMNAALGLAALAGGAWAQNVISAKSGLVHYIEGEVLLAGKPLHLKAASTDIKENQVLESREGRAEVLLTPGVFLRLGEKSSFRLLTNRLIDTRLELLTGSAVVEAAEIGKYTGVTVVCNAGTVTLRKKGLYRIDADPARLRVYDGEASVLQGGHTVLVTGGKALSLQGVPVVARFDRNATDELARWSRRRGEYIAMANVSTAKMLRDSGYQLYTSAWGYNPYFGMWTFLPCSGSMYSPYGFRYWSPAAVMRVYYVPPAPVYRNDTGWNNTSASSSYSYSGPTSSGYSGASASSYESGNSVSTSAAGAASSSVGSGSSSGGGRHR